MYIYIHTRIYARFFWGYFILILLLLYGILLVELAILRLSFAADG